MIRASTAALLAALLSCGGRSPLEPGESDALASSGSAGAPSFPGSGASSTGGLAPNGGAPNGTAGGEMSPAGASGSSVTAPHPVPVPDVNCTSDRAKGGMACSVPCVTTCGFHGLGTKTCDCVSGVFVSCHCPRPWDYQGATTAPVCATPDGRTHWLDNTPCADEWRQCLGTDPVPGTNPRGCVCLTDPVNGKLEWTCGSTNRWFLRE